MPVSAPEFLPLAGGRSIAFRTVKGESPGIVWLGGFKSDMLGTKAEALSDWAEKAGRAFLRFDYSGHGESSGRFEDGTISQWASEAQAAFEALTTGPQVLVGSSMGGWMALLLARALKQAGQSDRLKAMVLIAPAPDFTERLMWPAFSEEVRQEIMETGQWLRPSAYDPVGYPITRALIEDGRRNLLLDHVVETGCPVHVLQGMQDPDVPWQHAMLLVERMARDDVSITLIKDGDHRLSRDEDIALLIETVERLST